MSLFGQSARTNSPQHIGIVGCSAPGAAFCYETICTVGASGEYGTAPEVSLHTHPFERYMQFIKAGDWNGVADLMLSSTEKLAQVGANFCVAPCNTVHAAFELVNSRSPLPWLHIAEETAREAKRSGHRKIGLLGTALTMEGTVYSSRLAKFEIECCIPQEPDRRQLNDLILSQMVHGRFMSEARAYVLSLFDRLSEDGCDAIVLGCTELPILLRGESALLPILDSTSILAMAALIRSTTVSLAANNQSTFQYGKP